MPKPPTLTVDHRARVTAADVNRFAGAIEIRDVRAFADALEVFVHERLVGARLDERSAATKPERMLARKAKALRAGERWVPGETEIQRGRAAMLHAFDQSHNLPLPEYARLANKSRQQIYKDIDSRRLLALSVGPRGRRLPEWQLDPIGRQLTQTVMQQARHIDDWTLYRALSEPLEGLGGRSPVEAAAGRPVEDVANAVLNALVVH